MGGWGGCRSVCCCLPTHTPAPLSQRPPLHPPPQVQAFFQEICGPAVHHLARGLGPTHHAAAQEASGGYGGGGPRGGLAGGALPRNILSFGDSVHERSAILRVTAAMGAGVRTKSIKFVERPTIEQLKRQVDLVASCFDAIVGHSESLDLMLTIHLLYNNSL